MTLPLREYIPVLLVVLEFLWMILDFDRIAQAKLLKR
jgi:hypothetical protein